MERVTKIHLSSGGSQRPLTTERRQPPSDLARLGRTPTSVAPVKLIERLLYDRNVLVSQLAAYKDVRNYLVEQKSEQGMVLTTLMLQRPAQPNPERAPLLKKTMTIVNKNQILGLNAKPERAHTPILPGVNDAYQSSSPQSSLKWIFVLILAVVALVTGLALSFKSENNDLSKEAALSIVSVACFLLAFIAILITEHRTGGLRFCEWGSIHPYSHVFDLIIGIAWVLLFAQAVILPLISDSESGPIMCIVIIVIVSVCIVLYSKLRIPNFRHNLDDDDSIVQGGLISWGMAVMACFVVLWVGMMGIWKDFLGIGSNYDNSIVALAAAMLLLILIFAAFSNHMIVFTFAQFFGIITAFAYVMSDDGDQGDKNSGAVLLMMVLQSAVVGMLPFIGRRAANISNNAALCLLLVLQVVYTLSGSNKGAAAFLGLSVKGYSMLLMGLQLLFIPALWTHRATFLLPIMALSIIVTPNDFTSYVLVWSIAIATFFLIALFVKVNITLDMVRLPMNQRDRPDVVVVHGHGASQQDGDVSVDKVLLLSHVNMWSLLMKLTIIFMCIVWCFQTHVALRDGSDLDRRDSLRVFMFCMLLPIMVVGYLLGLRISYLPTGIHPFFRVTPEPDASSRPRWWPSRIRPLDFYDPMFAAKKDDLGMATRAGFWNHGVFAGASLVLTSAASGYTFMDRSDSGLTPVFFVLLSVVQVVVVSIIGRGGPQKSTAYSIAVTLFSVTQMIGAVASRGSADTVDYVPLVSGFVLYVFTVTLNMAPDKSPFGASHGVARMEPKIRSPVHIAQSGRSAEKSGLDGVVARLDVQALPEAVVERTVISDVGAVFGALRPVFWAVLGLFFSLGIMMHVRARVDEVDNVLWLIPCIEGIIVILAEYFIVLWHGGELSRAFGGAGPGGFRTNRAVALLRRVLVTWVLVPWLAVFSLFLGNKGNGWITVSIYGVLVLFTCGQIVASATRGRNGEMKSFQGDGSLEARLIPIDEAASIASAAADGQVVVPQDHDSVLSKTPQYGGHYAPKRWRAVWATNVRDAPSLDASEVAFLARHTEVVSTGEEGAWIQHDGGWSLTRTSDNLELLAFIGPAYRTQVDQCTMKCPACNCVFRSPEGPIGVHFSCPNGNCRRILSHPFAKHPSARATFVEATVWLFFALAYGALQEVVCRVSGDCRNQLSSTGRNNLYGFMLAGWGVCSFVALLWFRQRWSSYPALGASSGRSPLSLIIPLSIVAVIGGFWIVAELTGGWPLIVVYVAMIIMDLYGHMGEYGVNPFSCLIFVAGVLHSVYVTLIVNDMEKNQRTYEIAAIVAALVSFLIYFAAGGGLVSKSDNNDGILKLRRLNNISFVNAFGIVGACLCFSIYELTHGILPGVVGVFVFGVWPITNGFPAFVVATPIAIPLSFVGLFILEGISFYPTVVIFVMVLSVVELTWLMAVNCSVTEFRSISASHNQTLLIFLTYSSYLILASTWSGDDFLYGTILALAVFFTLAGLWGNCSQYRVAGIVLASFVVAAGWIRESSWMMICGATLDIIAIFVHLVMQGVCRRAPTIPG